MVTGRRGLSAVRRGEDEAAAAGDWLPWGGGASHQAQAPGEAAAAAGDGLPPGGGPRMGHRRARQQQGIG